MSEADVPSELGYAAEVCSPPRSDETPAPGDLAAPQPMDTVHVRGTDTRYQTFGDPGAGTTIIAVHGFRGDHHGMIPIAAHLRTFRIIVPDLPGFGGSEPLCGRPHDVEGYADWLAAFVRAVVPGPAPVVLGHSFGSIIAAAAVAGGMPVAGLVLVNPIAAPALHGPHPLLSRLALGYYRLGAVLPEWAGSRLLGMRGIVRVISELTTKTSDPRLRSWIHDQHRRWFSTYANRRVVVEAFEASIGHDVTDYAAHIASPTLLIGADSDDVTPVRQQERLVRLFPDARLLVLADVGHLIHYERPRAAARAITEFVTG